MIIRGKDKGETGTIKRVIRSQNRVIVEGKNLVRYLFLLCLMHLENECTISFLIFFVLDLVCRV